MRTKQTKPEPVVAYTMAQAARFLEVTPTQVTRLIEEGRLVETGLVAGTGRYLTAESVEAYRKEQLARREEA